MSARAERSGSPEAILLASRSHDASSGILPVAHILPAASAAAGKPLASAAREGAQGDAPLRGARRVERVPERGRDVPPERRLRPRPRPRRQRRYERRRVPHRSATRDVAPGQQGRPPPARVEDLDGGVAHADDHVAAVPAGPGEVERPIDAHPALLVGAPALPPHRVEPLRGQRQARRQVLLEELADRGPSPRRLRRHQPQAALEQAGVELLERRRRRDRHHQVPAEEPDGVLDRPLLVARVGVAVGGGAAVVRPQRGEQRALADRVPDPAPALGGVVEHELARGAADRVEDLREGPAGVLGPLRPGEHLEARVGVREGDDQGVQPLPRAADVGEALAVVHLGAARRPLELEEAVSGPSPRLPPLPHEALDRRERPLVALLGDEPVVDPPRRVALLAGRARVRLEPGPHGPGVRVDGGPAALPRDGRRRGEVALAHVLGDGVPADAEAPCDLPARASPRVHLADAPLSVD